MAKKKRTKGPELRRLHPKLRMIKNGKTEVNLLRAEHSSGLAARSASLLRGFAKCRHESTGGVRPEDLPKTAKPTSLKEVSGDVTVNVFVDVNDSSIIRRLPGVQAVCGNLLTAQVPLSRLDEIARNPKVATVQMGEALKAPDPAVDRPEAKAPSPTDRWVGSEQLHGYGENVLIGIVDVQGFDFSHPDFLDAKGRTRFEYIWDQGGNARPSPGGRFKYGAEFTGDDLNRSITASTRLGLPAWEIERQSQVRPSSHGTHVASIAAGNRGVCRKAKIAGVLISLPEADTDSRLSFYDSTRIVDAVDYLVERAKKLECTAVSVNISLGTNGHAHDASSPLSRWIDSTLATPGRSICVAAGNAGQEAPSHPNDIGYVMGRIHTSGRIAATGLDADIEWIVVGNSIQDISENELEIWYSSADRYAVSVRPPGWSSWIGPIEPGEFVENRQLPTHSFLSVYNELYHEANGSNYISIYLTPWLSRFGVVGVNAGTWTVRLHGREIRDGRYDGWSARDDPREIGRVGTKNLWRFPSFFSAESNVDRSSVSSMACGHRIISVANLDAASEQINKTSSQGPTRDGRHKPEVGAPGTDILAANGFDPDAPWVKMTGTSMASPYVAGIVGLMLAVDPTLTAAQIGGIIRRTAIPLPGDDYEWRDDAGYGVIAAAAGVREAATANINRDVTS